MIETVGRHYEEKYYAWQASIGQFGGWANLTKFSSHISETDDVLDFGCGGEYLLKSIKCRKKVGVEVNAAAADTARRNGIEVYQRVCDVPDNYVG